MHRNRFKLPSTHLYLCGHSLGPSPTQTRNIINRTLDDFETQAVMAWNSSHWISLIDHLSQKMAQMLGANLEEVTIGDSTTINLYKALRSALSLQSPKRQTILTTVDNFPADLYVANGCAKVICVPEDELLDHLSERVGVLLLTHVNYRNGRILNLANLCKKAAQQGILSVCDLSHSIGILPLNFAEDGPDFAVGCTYKYLSAGPGSPAFIYAKSKHHNAMQSPIQGWFGHTHPFAFDTTYQALGISKFQGGTPAIFSMKGLEAALNTITPEIVKQAYQQLPQHRDIMISRLRQLGLRTHAPQHGGGHVAFEHPDGPALAQALAANGACVDYRHPNLIRACVNPLYLSTQDLQNFADILQNILANQTHLLPQFQQPLKVT